MGTINQTDLNVYKVYVSTKKKDGTIIKSDYVMITSSPEQVEDKAIKEAKFYGFKGKVHIGGIFKKDKKTKQFIKAN